MTSTFSGDYDYVAAHGARLRALAQGNSPQTGAVAAVGQPQAPAAPQSAALDQQPAAPAQSAVDEPAGKSFWDISKDLSDKEKDAIAKQFEDKGVDIESEYNKLKSEGRVDPGLIKKGKDGKIDKRDMGLFLMEAGLRTMEKSSKPGATGFGAIGGAVLDTMDARRQRGAMDEKAQTDMADKINARADKKQENISRATDSAADRKSREVTAEADSKTRSADAAADRASRERMNREDNISRDRQVKMASGLDKQTFVDEETGDVYWKDSQEQVMVSDGKGGKKPLKGKTQQPKGEITPEQLQKARAAIVKQKSEDLTGRYGPERKGWNQLTDDEKNEIVDQELNLTLGNLQSPESTNVPAWAK